MAILVSDNFNRTDNPSSLGTATTGQVWTLVSGDFPFGILSNQAFWNRTGTGNAGLDAKVVVDAGLSDTKGQVRIMNVLAGGGLNLRNQGLVLRYVDSTHYIFVAYYRASGETGFRVYIADGGAPDARGFGALLTMVDGDTMGYACCGQTIQFYHNGVLACEGFVGPPLSATLLAGTKFGLMASGGIISDDDYQIYEDFLVETNGTCTPTYNCVDGACIDPGDGTGTYGTLAACLSGCGVVESYNCVDGVCVDPGDGEGEFATLLECELSGCTPRVAETQKFDAGNGSEWMLLAQLSDSGDELRSKNIKAGYVVGKVTNADFTIYPVDVGQPIDVEAMEDGTRTSGATRPQSLPDTVGVAQSPRKQVNVVNAVTHTIRVSGDDTGEETRDRIDQVTYEQDIQGVRR